MYLWVCMKYAWLDQLVLPNKKYEKIDSPMHVLHIAQVHGSSTDASSNGQTWYNWGERNIPSNTRQEQLWQRSSKLALFWPTIQFHHLLCQGKLHKSEKRATSSGGKSRFTSFNPPHSHLLPFQKAIIKKTSGGCVTSSSGDFGSSYRPFEQLVLPAWRKRSEWQILQMDSEFTQHFFRFPQTPSFFLCQRTLLVKLLEKLLKKKMNPNISALFTFPNKRFPGNPGSRPEPAWSLVPDAIMVNSPFVDIHEVFFKQIIKNLIYLCKH